MDLVDCINHNFDSPIMSLHSFSILGSEQFPSNCPPDSCCERTIAVIGDVTSLEVWYLPQPIICKLFLCSILTRIVAASISNGAIVALGKLLGSEGNHGQTAEHRQYFGHVAVREHPAVTLQGTNNLKCSVMHSGHEFNFTGAELIMLAVSYHCQVVTNSAASHEFKHKAAMSWR